MNQQEAQIVRKALHKAWLAGKTKEVIDPAIREGLREEPDIDSATEAITLAVPKLGDKGGRELGLQMYIFLEQIGYDWNKWK